MFSVSASSSDSFSCLNETLTSVCALMSLWLEGICCVFFCAGLQNHISAYLELRLPVFDTAYLANLTLPVGLLLKNQFLQLALLAD